VGRKSQGILLSEVLPAERLAQALAAG